MIFNRKSIYVNVQLQLQNIQIIFVSITRYHNCPFYISALWSPTAYINVYGNFLYLNVHIQIQYDIIELHLIDEWEKRRLATDIRHTSIGVIIFIAIHQIIFMLLGKYGIFDFRLNRNSVFFFVLVRLLLNLQWNFLSKLLMWSSFHTYNSSNTKYFTINPHTSIEEIPLWFLYSKLHNVKFFYF